MALSKGPGDERDDKEITALRRELQHIEAKDGKFTEWEKKRVDALNLILDAEPPLRNILVNLDVRQRKEISALADQQKQLPASDEKTYAIVRKQHSDLEDRHNQERQRYAREYHAAKTIRADIEKQERREALESSLNPDKPKLTR